MDDSDCGGRASGAFVLDAERGDMGDMGEGDDIGDATDGLGEVAVVIFVGISAGSSATKAAGVLELAISTGLLYGAIPGGGE